MSLAINGHFLPSYQVSCSEFVTPTTLIGCVGLPWAKRHWQLAKTDAPRSLGHRVIACLEALPVIGGIVVLIERIIAAIASRWQSPSSVSRSSVNKVNPDLRIANADYLFLARREGRSQEGCCGNVSVERADVVRQKLQERAPPGISFDSTIYHRSPAIIGTCTAMSLEFASTYYRLRKESQDITPGNEAFLNKMRLLSKSFEKSTEEMRSRQVAYSSITVDRTVNMDVTRNKVESCLKYHDFETDYCSKEMDIRVDTGLLQQEINTLSDGVYFVRMLMPTDNRKLEARGHSMIYVQEKDVRFFYDNNCGLEKMSALNSGANDTLLYERLLNVHKQWDIPMLRIYRLKPELSPNG